LVCPTPCPTTQAPSGELSSPTYFWVSELYCFNSPRFSETCGPVIHPTPLQARRSVRKKVAYLHQPIKRLPNHLLAESVGQPQMPRSWAYPGRRKVEQMSAMGTVGPGSSVPDLRRSPHFG
jgi:hypothetical protein